MVPYREIIYTGPMDEYFDYRYGKLPYRSLEFQHETLDQEQVPAGRRSSTTPTTTPTRASPSSSSSPGRSTPRRSIVYEYPRAEGDPYYPIPKPGVHRAVQPSTRSWPTARAASTSSGGWRRTSTTTWTRSSGRRWRPSTRSWSARAGARSSVLDRAGMPRRRPAASRRRPTARSPPRSRPPRADSG